METLKNLTLVQWIGIMVGLNSLLMGATPQLTVLFGEHAVPYIIAIATLGNGALGVFVTVVGGIGSQARNVINSGATIDVGPQAVPVLATMAVSRDRSTAGIQAAPGAGDAVAAIAKAAANILLAALLLGLFLGGDPAMAQTVKRPGPVLTGDLIQDAKDKFQGDPSKGVQLTGNLKQDALAVWKKIQDASKADLQYASLMAGAAKTPSSAVRKNCWDAIIAINAQTNGEGLKNADGSDAVKPDPALFTDVETIAEIMDSLSPQGPLFTSCAGAAELAKANVIQFISAAVSGAVGLAKLSPIPGL